MEHFLLLSVLFDYYNALLTPTQRRVCELYYNQNFSLSEISEHLKITRQGVHDSLKKAESTLLKTEEALKIYEKNEGLGALVSSLNELIQSSDMDGEKKKRATEITDKINSLL